MQMTNQRLGQIGEDIAANFLSECGFAILDRNWRCKRGEIDIVARDGNVLVFCEVKTRRSLSHGHPSEAVTYRKIESFRSGALDWLANHKIRSSGMRFDVVSIVYCADGTSTISHTRGIDG